MREELLNRELRIRGYLHAVISLNPYDTDRFHFEGAGRFFLVRERTGEILLNGDFHLIPKRHPISQLAAGYIDVDVRQIISRIPGEPTHLHDTTVRYRIHVEDSRAAHPVYLIEDPAHECAGQDPRTMAPPTRSGICPRCCGGCNVARDGRCYSPAVFIEPLNNKGIVPWAC